MNALFLKILLIKANTDIRSLYLKLKLGNFILLIDKIEVEHLKYSIMALKGIIIVDIIVITEVGEVEEMDGGEGEEEEDEAKVVVVNMVVVTTNKVILNKMLEKEATKEINKINTMKTRALVRIINEVITSIEGESMIGQESMAIMKIEVANGLEVIPKTEGENIIGQESMTIMKIEVASGLEVITKIEEESIISQESIKGERVEIIIELEVGKTL